MFVKTMSTATVLGVILAASPVLAIPNFETATLDTPGATRTLVLPAAADRSPVISLGTAVDPASGKTVEGRAIIHYKRLAAKPGGAGGGGKTCYTYLSRGAKWKTLEPWVMNPANTRGLDPAALFGLQDSALVKWEDAADGTVGNSAGVEIFGAGTPTDAALSADTVAPDGQNESYLGDVSTSGAIAVTIVWGIFAGPIQNRELVEWDQIYDQADFDWSAEAAGVAGKMDFANIATHEDGHSGGMGHPDDSCSEETMYRFSANAETKKRDLNAGDIAGVNALY